MKKYLFIALLITPIISFSQDVIRFGYDNENKLENKLLKNLRNSIGQSKIKATGVNRNGKNFIGFWRYDEMKEKLKDQKAAKTITTEFEEFGELFWGKAGQLQNSNIQIQDLGLGGIYTEVVSDIFGLARVSLAFSLTNSKGDTLSADAKKEDFKNYFNSGSGNAILKFQYPIFFGTAGAVDFEKRNYGLFFVPRIGFDIPKVGNSEKFKSNFDFGFEGQLFLRGIGNLISINNKVRLGYKFGELVGTQLVKEFVYGSYNCGLIVADKFSLNATIPINAFISSPIIKSSYNKSLSFGFTF